MKYANFKKHEIHRSCDKRFDMARKYRPYLQKDFHDRCCYCNMPRGLVTVPFHVEHFIPEDAFHGKKDSLKTDYNNLMWACPKCNLSKSNKYEGDLEHSDKIENLLFYNPVETDYDTIFYRNELGGIDSDDPKGREMIKLLKLYRPVHNLAWMVERLERTCNELERRLKSETDPDKRQQMEVAASWLSRIYVQKAQLFRAAYNGTRVFWEEQEE